MTSPVPLSPSSTATPSKFYTINTLNASVSAGSIALRKTKRFGTRAKQAASELVYRKEVTLQTFGKDKYGRTLADVLLPDGTNINHTLVKDGWCWWYQKYAPGDTVLEGLEHEAREARKGLWADRQPVPPWEWRAQRRDAVKGSPQN